MLHICTHQINPRSSFSWWSVNRWLIDKTKERISFQKAEKDLSFRSDIRDSVPASRLSVVFMIRSMHLRPTGTVNVAGGLMNVTSWSVSSGKRMRDGERE